MYEFIQNYYLLIIILISFIFNIFLLRRTLKAIDNHKKDYNQWVSILIKMREVDYKGYFEDDEEVGIVFNKLKKLIYDFK